MLNRGPRMTDLNGKGRVKKLSESLGVKISTMLVDGGKQVTETADHGVPLLEMAKKNPLRKDINKLAVTLHSRRIGGGGSRQGWVIAHVFKVPKALEAQTGRRP